MKSMRHWWMALVATFVVFGCSMPQDPVEFEAADETSGYQLSVKTDTSRNQGIYVNEQGEEFDLISSEGEALVYCVEAIDIVPLGSGTPATKSFFGSSPPVKALVLGRRNNGHPGIWEIHHDDTIHPLESGYFGVKSSELSATGELDWIFHGFFGWVYHARRIVGPDTQDGYIVVGYAENEDGFSFGRSHWQIPPDTTVAVYWQITKGPSGFYRISKARIIGEPSENYPQYQHRAEIKSPGNPYHHFRNKIRRAILNFRMFCLDWFKAYLVMPDFDSEELRFDNFLVSYVVPGTDQDTKPARAYITEEGEITIEQISGGNSEDETYPLIVIDTFAPSGQGSNDTFLTLYELVVNASNKFDLLFVAEDDDGNPDPSHDGFSRIKAEELLVEGHTYYIKVHKPTDYGGPYYGIRILDKEVTDFPSLDELKETNDLDDELYVDVAGYEDNVVPVQPFPIELGDEISISRALYPEGDIDWFVITLPLLF